MSGRSRVVTHVPLGSGVSDHRGVDICTCGSTFDASCHRVPERSEEQRVLEARRLGESE